MGRGQRQVQDDEYEEEMIEWHLEPVQGALIKRDSR